MRARPRRRAAGRGRNAVSYASFSSFRRLQLQAEAEIRTVVDLSDRCVLFRGIAVAAQAAVEVDRRAPEDQRRTDVVLQDRILLPVRLAEVDARRIGDRVRSARRRIVERRAEEIESAA